MKPKLSLSEQLTYCTTRIECTLSEGRCSVGTGFFFRFLEKEDTHIAALITNKHVVAGAREGRFRLHVADASGAPSRSEWFDVTLDDFERRWITCPDDTVDLCILPIAPLFQAAANQGKLIFLTTLDKSLIPTVEELASLGAIEDVVIVGYPIGLWDSINNQPIVRRGSTATHPAMDYEGRREFLIDAACFPGSSGSPVFLYNFGSYSTRDGGTVIGSRVKLLGILHAGPVYTTTGEIVVANIPTAQRAIAVSQIPINLGFVIRAERLLEFEPKLEAIVKIVTRGD
jgi:hypothetical protein